MAQLLCLSTFCQSCHLTPPRPHLLTMVNMLQSHMNMYMCHSRKFQDWCVNCRPYPDFPGLCPAALLKGRQSHQARLHCCTVQSWRLLSLFHFLFLSLAMFFLPRRFEVDHVFCRIPLCLMPFSW